MSFIKISAVEAKKTSDATLSERDTESFNTINHLIEKAILVGEYRITIMKKLSPKVIKSLEDAGYKINIERQTNPADSSETGISWE